MERLIAQLDGLVESGNTVVVVEHDMRVALAATGSLISALVQVTKAVMWWRSVRLSRSLDRP